MRPYSQDLRERILQTLQAHEQSQAALGARFAVSRSFVERLWQRWRQTGSGAALPHAGGRPRSVRGAEALIRQTVARDPAVTLARLCERIARSKGIAVSPKPLCLEIQRLRLPRKKNHSRPVSGRARGEGAGGRSVAGGGGGDHANG
jgi:transposase